LELLTLGHISLDERLRNVVDISVADLPEYVFSMFLDAATIMCGCIEAHALCAWVHMHSQEPAAAVRWGWAQLQSRSLIKLQSDDDTDVEVLWVHDVIKALAGRRASDSSRAAAIRLWREDQVSALEGRRSHKS
jgi:hypothetical protein